eukprot:9798416-Lingulodinium_polyedra.AAC.1
MPRLGVLAVYSIYLVPGQSLVATEVNIKVANALMTHIISHELEWIVAGDWNMDPQTLATMPWIERIGATILIPPEATCITPEARTVRDYMVLSSRLASTQQ